MSDAAPEEQKQGKERSPMVVASVLNSDRVVINRGTKAGVMVGHRFLIYESTEEEIIDPTTQKSLGYLEIPKGTGKIVSAQENMAVLESDEELKGKPNFWSAAVAADAFTSGTKAPFRDPKVGDRVKLLK